MNRKEESIEKKWIKWMKIGEKTGCHQKPERSFSIKGYQMPVCARCSGVFLGYFLAGLCCIYKGWKPFCKTALFGCDIMLIDWTIQAWKIKESTNKRRFFTGILGGFGIMIFFIGALCSLFSNLTLLAKSSH